MPRGTATVTVVEPLFVASVVVEDGDGNSNITIDKGQTVQLFAIGTWSDGVQEDFAAYPGVWATDDPNIVTVDSLGLATGHNAGTVNVHADVPDFP
jgi:uncharacterized protein YjdB